MSVTSFSEAFLGYGRYPAKASRSGENGRAESAAGADALVPKQSLDYTLVFNRKFDIGIGL